MAKNGISTLATKEERQIAKLELAQTKRQVTGTPGYRELRYYDLSLLPTKYVGDTVFDNPNTDGLVQGRPWKTTPNITLGLWRSAYVGYWNGDPTWFDNSPVAMDTEGAVQDFSLAPYAGNTNCSFQWLGYFRAPKTANYTFYMYTDDGAMLWIGNAAITAYTSSNADLTTSAPSGELSTDPLSFEEGDYVPIRIQYGNNLGQGYFNFSWSSDYVYQLVTTGMVCQLVASDYATTPSEGTWQNRRDYPIYNAGTTYAPTFAAVSPPYCFEYNGDNSYWDINNPTTGDFTAAVWFKTDSTDGTGTHFYDNPALIGGDVPNVANDWGMVISNGRVGVGAVSGQTVFTTTQYNDNAWHCATVVRVKTTGIMKLFVDGVLKTQTTEAPNENLIASDRLRLGADPVNEGQAFTGSIAEFDFWQVALTDTDVATNWEAQRGDYGV